MGDGTDESHRPTSPRQSQRCTSAAPTWFTITLATGLFAWVFLQPVIGDERLQYALVFSESARVWPVPNMTMVSYGISALYLWIVGGLMHLVEEPILVGRLLSWTSHAWLLSCCFVRGRLAHGLMLLILLHPMTLLYAVRAHPFLPGVALLFAATTVVARHPRWAIVLTALATHVQAFLLPSTLLVPLQTWLTCRGESVAVWVRRCLCFSAAGLIGVVSNWLIYGGQYPQGFTESPTYQTFNTGSPSLGYLVLIPAFVGFWGWIGGPGFGQHANRRLMITLGIVATVFSILLLQYASAPALGPVASILRKVNYGLLYGMLLGFLSVGWMWLPRDHRLLVPAVGTAAAVATIVRLPWFYERYAWFAANTIMLIFVNRTPIRGIDDGQSRFWWVALLLTAFGAVQFSDIVVTNRIDPLWLWDRHTP